MKITILTGNLPLSGAERNDIRKRLKSTLSEKRSTIDTVQIALCNLPSFASEAVFHCRLEVSLADGRVILVDSTASSLETVLQRATNRVGRNLAHGIGKRSKTPAAIAPVTFMTRRTPETANLKRTA